jgi:hypothetical protein
MVSQCIRMRLVESVASGGNIYKSVSRLRSLLKEELKEEDSIKDLLPIQVII